MQITNFKANASRIGAQKTEIKSQISRLLKKADELSARNAGTSVDATKKDLRIIRDNKLANATGKEEIEGIRSEIWQIEDYLNKISPVSKTKKFEKHKLSPENSMD